MTDRPAAPVVVKRYGDRLYLTADARYVDRAELRRMAEAGIAIVVVDAETGADVTDLALADALDRSAADERWRATVDALEAVALETRPDPPATDADEAELDPAGDVRRLIAVRLGAVGRPPSATSKLPAWWSRAGQPSAPLSPEPRSDPAATEPDPAVPCDPPRWRDGPRRD